MKLTFFDETGHPAACAIDGTHIHLQTGEPVAYLFEDSIYSYSGAHLGWYLDGWVHDHSGSKVYFTELAATAHTPLVLKKFPPFPTPQTAKETPIPARRRPKPLKPAFNQHWSCYRGPEFFGYRRASPKETSIF